jgi:hypothetical protein
MVTVDSPWWQWHLNDSRLSFLCLFRNIILLIKNGGEFSFIVYGLWYLLCCDLYKEIKMAALYIWYVSFLAFRWGRNSYSECDAFLGVSVFLPYWTPPV